ERGRCDEADQRQGGQPGLPAPGAVGDGAERGAEEGDRDPGDGHPDPPGGSAQLGRFGDRQGEVGREDEGDDDGREGRVRPVEQEPGGDGAPRRETGYGVHEPRPPITASPWFGTARSGRSAWRAPWRRRLSPPPRAGRDG